MNATNLFHKHFNIQLVKSTPNILRMMRLVILSIKAASISFAIPQDKAHARETKTIHLM
jgi:hypothetical protein